MPFVLCRRDIVMSRILFVGVKESSISIFIKEIVTEIFGVIKTLVTGNQVVSIFIRNSAEQFKSPETSNVTLKLTAIFRFSLILSFFCFCFCFIIYQS